MESYNKYMGGHTNHSKSMIFDQVTQIRNQLESAILSYIQRIPKTTQIDQTGESENDWNANSSRVVAQSALLCCATPRIAHLVHGRDEFATRDVAGTAKIHPSSVNHCPSKRAFWYLYHELRIAEEPYLHTTTAVSPLEIALFCDSDFLLQPKTPSKFVEVNALYEHMKEAFGDVNWLYHVDHWIPVVTSEPSQRNGLLRLRRLLQCDMLQQVALDPITFARNLYYQQIVLYVLSALEQQRLPPPPPPKRDSSLW